MLSNASSSIAQNKPVAGEFAFTKVCMYWLTPLRSTKSGIIHPVTEVTILTSCWLRNESIWLFIKPLLVK